jgi:hypothetical protein
MVADVMGPMRRTGGTLRWEGQWDGWVCGGSRFGRDCDKKTQGAWMPTLAWMREAGQRCDRGTRPRNANALFRASWPEPGVPN